MGGGKKVKLGGLLGEKKEGEQKKEGGMFASRIAVNYLVSDYMHFKFFYLTWENALMQNSFPNKVKDKDSYFLINKFNMSVLLSPQVFLEHLRSERWYFDFL